MLFPAIDLREGKVVRLVQGDFNRQTVYRSDPLAQAQVFAGEGARWVHVVDLDAARTGQLRHLELIGRICRESGLRVQAGGGVRSEAAVDQLLSMGVERVVVGTAAFRNWEWFEKLVHQRAYRGRIVLGLDGRRGKVAVAGWQEETDLTVLDVARRVSGWPLAAIVYTEISADGTLSGPDVAGIRQLVQATRVPVIASGGVGSLEDLRVLAGLPLEGVIVGRALYEGRFSVAEALKVLEEGARQTKGGGGCCGVDK